MKVRSKQFFPSKNENKTLWRNSDSMNFHSLSSLLQLLCLPARRCRNPVISMQSICQRDAREGWRRDGLPSAESKCQCWWCLQKNRCQWQQRSAVVQVFKAKTKRNLWRRHQMELHQILSGQKWTTSWSIRTNHLTKEHHIQNWCLTETMKFTLFGFILDFNWINITIRFFSSNKIYFNNISI